jgi:hypothetical protein
LALDIPLLPALPLLPFDHLPLRHLPLTLPVHSSQSIHSDQPDSGPPPASPLKPAELNSSTSSPAQSVELTLVPEPLEKPSQLPDRKPEIRKSDNPNVNLKDVLAAINGLSQLTTQYLGTMVVSNYWKATRPPVDWLNHFQIERSGQMTFSVQMPSQRLPILTSEQYRCLQAWVLAFIEHCSHVIRNFAQIVRHSLTDQQSMLLFGTD